MAVDPKSQAPAKARTAAKSRGPAQAKAGQEPPSTGHVWDGIREYDNPLPRWWLWTFYACIAYAIVYMVLYPAWPLLNGATPGVLGASSRADVAADIQQFADANAPVRARLVAADLTQVTADADLADNK